MVLLFFSDLARSAGQIDGIHPTRTQIIYWSGQKCELNPDQILGGEKGEKERVSTGTLNYEVWFVLDWWVGSGIATHSELEGRRWKIWKEEDGKYVYIINLTLPLCIMIWATSGPWLLMGGNVFHSPWFPQPAGVGPHHYFGWTHLKLYIMLFETVFQTVSFYVSKRS